MKLVRAAACALVALSAACASAPAPAPAAPAATPDAVSTTRVNAALWDDEAAPRVGKPQRSDDASNATEESLGAPKDEPRRNEGRHLWK